MSSEHGVRVEGGNHRGDKCPAGWGVACYFRPTFPATIPPRNPSPRDPGQQSDAVRVVSRVGREAGWCGVVGREPTKRGAPDPLPGP